MASNSNEKWAFTPFLITYNVFRWNTYGWLSDKLLVIQNQDAIDFLRFKRQGSACLQQQVAMQNASLLQLGKKQQDSRKYSSSLLE